MGYQRPLLPPEEELRPEPEPWEPRPGGGEELLPRELPPLLPPLPQLPPLLLPRPSPPRPPWLFPGR